MLEGETGGVEKLALEGEVARDAVHGVAGDLGLERQFLHAARVAFDHPFTGKLVEVESPLPAELGAALERAGGSG